ncbi:type II toxin-antitoxin system RelE/ParE family toxin [Endothiovibrio diazotrophicus]
MSYRVRLTPHAQETLSALYHPLAEEDPATAREAREIIAKGLALLRDLPFTCRKADPDNPFLRELHLPFGDTGCVALFEIEDRTTLTLLTVRPLREEDYH